MKLSTREQLRQEAISLLGQNIIRTTCDAELIGKIIEVELYCDDDPASHSYNGKTKRNESMFLARNHAYVYFTYGMHYCLNVVVGEENQGAAVLIRALEPLSGIEIMRQNRLMHTQNYHDKDIANGPAKLTQAFAIDKEFNGHSLIQAPLRIGKGDFKNHEIICSRRIGITKAADELLRFHLRR